MEQTPHCPVCGETRWHALGTRTYRKVAGGKSSPYVRKRLEVLFSVWFPEQSEVMLTSQLCSACGFICSTPRPEASDLDAKYSFLAGDVDAGGEISGRKNSDAERSRQLYSALVPYLSHRSAVLDFGGGNGRLMPSLLAAGHSCALIDLPGKTLQGVEYLGSRISDVEAGRVFDVVVASHVLEHVASPLEVVRALRPYVSEGGILYVEVPLEIWGGPPLPEEPVTHINFFSVGSLQIMLERAGYRVVKCEEGRYTTEDGVIGLAVRAYARLAEAKRHGIDYRAAAEATRRLVTPGFGGRLRRAWHYPDIALHGCRKELNRRLEKIPVLWRLARPAPRPR